MSGSIGATFAILAAALTLAMPDWTDCPAACRCKWTSGKKSALCRDAGFTTVPTLNSEIQVLDLNGNVIPYLTKEAFKTVGLVNLQRIFLRGTTLRELHPDAFRNLSILVEVDLSQNQLTKIHPDTFTGNNRLRYLNLSGNPLQTLISEQLPVLQHLKTLELEHCSLRFIHRRAFVNLPQLETVNLNGNLLENISESVFSSLVKLKTLKLDNNPWRCDCGLREFRQWVVEKNLYSIPLICTEPRGISGHTWLEIPPDDFACGPEVTISEKMVQEEVGGNVTFRCRVFGDPEPEVQWLFNGRPLNSSVGDQIYLDEGSGSDKWVVLSVYNVSEGGAGEYTCFARNIRGNSTGNATLLLPEVVTATTLSKAESWLLVAGLVAGGVATFFSVTLAIVCTMCMCGRQRRRKRRRRKSKLKGSLSFTDQEKKLLDVSITTTERPSNAESIEALGPEMELTESGSIPMELCEPVRITIESRTAEPLTVFPPPPEFSSVLPAGAFGNIFISVSVSQEPDAVVRFPDLLDIPRARATIATGPEGPYIPTQTFATLPRRPKHLDRPVYDNMGPRVTAGGSSTLSLPEADENMPPTPPPPPLCAPLDYVSL